MSRLILGVLASVAEFERELIRERTRLGLAAARKRGVKLGRRQKPRPATGEVAKLSAAGKSWPEISAALGCTTWLQGRQPRRGFMAVTTPCELRYPVLALSYKGLAYTVADEVTLRSGNALALRHGYFEKLRAIDSVGALYRVTRVHGARIAPGEWLGRIFGRFANPRMTVELEMEQERALTLDEAKEEVRAGIRKIAHALDEGHGGTRYVLMRVNRATSWSELFACFTGLV